VLSLADRREADCIHADPPRSHCSAVADTGLSWDPLSQGSAALQTKKELKGFSFVPGESEIGSSAVSQNAATGTIAGLFDAPDGPRDQGPLREE
jgi:hypothetical protein